MHLKKLFVSVCFISFYSGHLFAQNLEMISGKELQQPGKVNPAMVGFQEELFRILSKAEFGQSYQLMVEGRVPLTKGSYLLGLERINSNNVNNTVFNLAYSKKIKKKKDIQWRFGGNVKFNQKTLINTDFDSLSGYSYRDLDGITYFLSDLKNGHIQRSFIDLELGVTLDYKSLFAGLSFENVTMSNVSHQQFVKRNLPFTGNLVVGGFLAKDKEWVVLPNIMMSFNQEALLVKSGVDISYKNLNFSGRYNFLNTTHFGETMVGMKSKKSVGGIRFSYQINELNVNQSPFVFDIFYNTSLFKKRDLFRSELAKRMRLFY